MGGYWMYCVWCEECFYDEFCGGEFLCKYGSCVICPDCLHKNTGFEEVDEDSQKHEQNKKRCLQCGNNSDKLQQYMKKFEWVRDNFSYICTNIHYLYDEGDIPDFEELLFQEMSKPRWTR